LQHSSGEKAISYIHLLLNEGGTESMEMTAEMVMPCMEMTAEMVLTCMEITAEQKHTAFGS
jgi:thiaminase